MAMVADNPEEFMDMLRGMIGNSPDVKDPELHRTVERATHEVERSQQASNAVSEAILALGVKTSPFEKWVQSFLVGLAGAQIGSFDLLKGVYGELIEANQHLSDIHDLLAKLVGPEEESNTETIVEDPMEIQDSYRDAFGDTEENNK